MTAFQRWAIRSDRNLVAALTILGAFALMAVSAIIVLCIYI